MSPTDKELGVSIWSQQSATVRWLQTVLAAARDVLNRPPFNDLKTLSCASSITNWFAVGWLGEWEEVLHVLGSKPAKCKSCAVAVGVGVLRVMHSDGSA